MNTSYKHGCLMAAVLVAIAVLAIAPGAQAAVLQWDPLFWGPGTGTASGGPGAWDGSPSWFNGSANVVWSDNNTAEFGGTYGGGDVTNDSDRIVAGMNFAGNYTLSGTGIITLNAGATIRADSTTEPVSVISSTLAGSSGFQKTGAGTLKLTGTNTFSGNVVISEGTLLVGTANNVGQPGSLGPTQADLSC
jgi:autotransporter-associated beta strand protein